MHDDLAQLVRDAAAEPRDTPDFSALAVRGRRERLLIRAATGVVGVAALMLGGVLLWPSPQGTMPVVGDDASVPAEPDDAVATLPAGWQWVDAGSVRFAVPGSWDIVSTMEKNAAHCSLFYSSPPMVLTGPLPPPVPCPAPDYTNPGPGVRATTATTAPEVPDGADTETLIVNGWPAVHWTETATSEVNGETVERRFAVYWFDHLDLYVKVRTDTAPGLARQIISTLAPAVSGAECRVTMTASVRGATGIFSSAEAAARSVTSLPDQGALVPLEAGEDRSVFGWVRDGRLLYMIDTHRGGGGWTVGSYEKCEPGS